MQCDSLEMGDCLGRSLAVARRRYVTKCELVAHRSLTRPTVFIISPCFSFLPRRCRRRESVCALAVAYTSLLYPLHVEHIPVDCVSKILQSLPFGPVFSTTPLTGGDSEHSSHGHLYNFIHLSPLFANISPICSTLS